MSVVLPKLLASDLDGTFLNSSGAVSAANRAAVQRAHAAGLRVVFITGRPARWIQMVADATGHYDIIIGANGGFIADMQALEVIHRDEIPPSHMQQAVKRIRRAYPDATFAAERAFVGMPIAESFGGSYNAMAVRDLSHYEFAISPGYTSQDRYHPQIPVVDVEVMVAQTDVVKLIVRPADAAEWTADSWLAEIEPLVEDIVGVTHAAQTQPQAELSALGVDKGSALQWLAESMGLTAHDVVAVGDMPNDLPMLSWAGQAWAVANAHPEVHAAVQQRLPHHDEDAIASLISRLLDGA